MLDPSVVGAVVIGNLKAISEQPAMLSNLAYSNVVSSNNIGQQNAVSNQQAGNQLGTPLVAKAVNLVSDMGPLAARSAVDVLSNNELSQTIADLKSSVQAFAGPQGPSRLRRLLDLGLEIDAKGQLVVHPPVPAIFIPGKVAREDIEIVLSDQGVTVKVKKVG
ncbi:RebB family R body protein [Lysobacter sp. SG-8]|uniref:RebB family R body protein n=1 Tax=Marilutibacter penaei TaxID=2759900 RepID=A0A7W3YCT4_9GAMM|nr:RebB family R body protein [Lysobacter penaei]MBB1087044.1 RebB family R body protein [Lysobacter penaei]